MSKKLEQVRANEVDLVTLSGGPCSSYTTALEGGDMVAENKRILRVWSRRRLKKDSDGEPFLRDFQAPERTNDAITLSV